MSTFKPQKTTKYDTLSDKELINLLKYSDTAALKEIFMRYRTLLLLYTYRRVNNNMEITQDLIHKIFIYLWKNRASINTSESIRPLLIELIKNKIPAHIKQTQLSSKHLANLEEYLKTREDTPPT